MHSGRPGWIGIFVIRGPIALNEFESGQKVNNIPVVQPTCGGLMCIDASSHHAHNTVAITLHYRSLVNMYLATYPQI